MRRVKPTLKPVDADAPANAPSESPLSLSRLRDAFASMLGKQEVESREHSAKAKQASELPTPRSPLPAPCEINPRTVVEAMLFVGRPDNGALSARELARRCAVLVPVKSK